jgi:hypothetical protein
MDSVIIQVNPGFIDKQVNFKFTCFTSTKVLFYSYKSTHTDANAPVGFMDGTDPYVMLQLGGDAC